MDGWLVIVTDAGKCQRQPSTMAKWVIEVILPTPVAAALSPSEPLNLNRQ